jgi:hypothetical protein
MEFQKENDLAATGSLNKETLDKMEIDSNFNNENYESFSE